MVREVLDYLFSIAVCGLVAWIGIKKAAWVKETQPGLVYILHVTGTFLAAALLLVFVYSMVYYGP